MTTPFLPASTDFQKRGSISTDTNNFSLNQEEVYTPRILFVTPEISYVSSCMCDCAEYIRAKAGGLADVSSLLVEQLIQHGTDVHLAIPHYKNVFQQECNDPSSLHCCLSPDSRVHLAEDSSFYKRMNAYHGDSGYLRGASLAFQREVINNMIPRIKPDIVHCNDWMTGLIPAACKKMGIKTLFTLHNIHREKTSIAEAESRGIDISEFWESLYYDHFPNNFDESYHDNHVDPLLSGIINADYVNTVSPTFLQELIQGKHGNIPDSVRDDLNAKRATGYAQGILNSPNPHYNPSTDKNLIQRYTHLDQYEGKLKNKLYLQEKLGLEVNKNAPLFFWPSRLDPVQKGCQLLSDSMFRIIEKHKKSHIQFTVVADGEFQKHFHEIRDTHQIKNQLSVCNFDESLSHLAFAASDFVLMPSSFEPCGLPQMIGCLYGSIPIAHNTGGLHDTVSPFKNGYKSGNGILFNNFDTDALSWAIDQAMIFHQYETSFKRHVIERIMLKAQQNFSTETMLSHYTNVYYKLSSDRLKNTT